MTAALRAAASLWESLSWVDTVVLVAVLASATAGFLSGFLWQVLRTAALLAAFVVATHFHGPLASYVGGEGPEPAVLIVSYLGLLVGVLFAAYVALFLLRGPINALKVQLFDRLLGVVVGAAKGLLICGILSLVVLTYAPTGTPLAQSVRSSSVAYSCARGARFLWKLMPFKAALRS